MKVAVQTQLDFAIYALKLMFNTVSNVCKTLYKLMGNAAIQN